MSTPICGFGEVSRTIGNRMKRPVVFVALLALCFTAQIATAKMTSIDISSDANSTWCGELNQNCASFPFGKQSYNGIPFLIPGNTQGTANNAWFAYAAANGGSGSVSITIPVNVLNVKTVYTLMNTMWGGTQAGLLSVTFNGTNGATWTVDPLGNVMIRDYNNNNSTTNSIACHLPGGVGKATTINAWTNDTGQRLD